MKNEIVEVTRQRISEALFLIGFGVVWAFDLWWPGLLVAFGISWSTSLSFRRKYWAAMVVVVLLCVIPVSYLVAQSWDPLIPFLVVSVGVAGLARAVCLQRENQATK
jgi:CHASE2 domain-containing sensor protein